MAHCKECNSILKTFEGDTCNACIKDNYPITSIELEQLKELLESLEWETVNTTGVRKISGGFATATHFDYDEEYIDVELKWGVQSDCEDTVHTEQLKVSRDTMRIED